MLELDNLYYDPSMIDTPKEMDTIIAIFALFWSGGRVRLPPEPLKIHKKTNDLCFSSWILSFFRGGD